MSLPIGPLVAFAIFIASVLSQSSDPGYNCIPSQSCWPSSSEWQAFNSSVGGNVFATVPWAAPCYLDSGYYNYNLCQEIASVYEAGANRSSVYGASEALNWEGCNATGCALESLIPSLPTLFQECSLGRLSPYYVAVQSAEQIATTLNFTKAHNLRLSIKNTGHDYLGKHTSPNSLAIWTHKMNSLAYHEDFTAYNCPSANGQNIGEMGAGVQASDAYTFFENYNMNVPGGNEGSVGLAGGFGQGGGHGIFGPSHGLMVDNAVEFDVVTADGQIRTINECNDPDLFWAMRGGGGGTYAVLTAYRFQLHAAVPINVYTVKASFSLFNLQGTLKDILTAHANNQSTWSANNVSGHAYYFPDRVELYLVLPSSNSSALQAVTSDFNNFVSNYPGLTISQNNYTTYPTYTSFLTLTQSIANRLTPSGLFEVLGGRLIPRNLFTSTNVTSLVSAVMQGITTAENLLSYISSVPTQIIMTTPANGPDGSATGANPAWRSALWHLVYSGGWTKDIPTSIQDAITSSILDSLDPVKALTPGGGCYLNEGHFGEPDWEQTFFGSNYDRLLNIKNQYDPSHLFDCWKCVGWRGESDPFYSCYA